jgi:hypothetical protein
MEKHIKILGKTVISWGSDAPIATALVKPEPKPVNLPAQRSSVQETGNTISYGQNNTDILQPEYYLDLIPHIRKLVSTNPNMAQALTNIVELGNTGHNIKFDPEVKDEQIVKMRQHLDLARKTWAYGKADADGISDKWMRQIMASGALSVEWVPKPDLSGIKMVAMVNPETIRFGYDKRKNEYTAYQKVDGIPDGKFIGDNLIKLNPNTYRYYAINGDTDIPYAIPPYLAALDPLKTQKVMLDNIKFLMEQLGLAGFMEMLMDKPEQDPNESWDAYLKRLDVFLDAAKDRVKLGFRDGISVGYKGDTEFKFHSVSKSMGGVNEFFIMNEMLFSSGLNMDPSMMGRNYGTSESQITIVFTKLLSQLNTIQQMVAACWEHGYAMELRLAGFQFKTLKVEFNPSTALDELKYQQAEEIMIRNANQLYADGIISQEQYAQKVGYETASQAEPRFLPTSLETPQDRAARQKAENEGKNKTDAVARRKKTNKDIKQK